ncbi:uncharacterized protein [Rutidosis leptorrhynchoides]|uniref:uncharacterized protein n=1 Tax=Rutidosis leptorrhynchoides TaxID=125765 RepID=UPI003A999497
MNNGYFLNRWCLKICFLSLNENSKVLVSWNRRPTKELYSSQMPKMDRNKWMYEILRSSHEFLTELSEFMKVADADRVRKQNKKVSCPCKKCQNFKAYADVRMISQHLIVNGFVDEYICWSCHGELLVDNHNVSYEGSVDGTNGNTDSHDDGYHDNLDDMLHDLERNMDENEFDKFQQNFIDSEKPLYAGCTKFTKLSTVLRLVNLKANNNWSDKSFTSLLELLHDMLPEDNELPVSYYQAKKLCARWDWKSKEYTHVQMIVYYIEISIKTCMNVLLKRLFGSPKDAKLLRWHVEERKKDGKIRHVADSSQWRTIDNVYTEFGQEIRNIRFGLSLDGFNPFRNMSSRHSTWPVILCVYNLPPWLCMKRKYIMMSLLIQGPKQPGNDIDVYLAPLIDDLQTLWSPGVSVYDAYKKETFNLRSMIFFTIIDFPAYGNLSGYNTKGAKACPICEDETCSRWLKHCRKMVFMGHQKSLERYHPYRRKKDLFDGNIENGSARSPLGGEMTFSRVKNINVVFGKTNKNREKGLLLNIQGKSKDGVKVRQDMEEMNIRKELHPVKKEGKRSYLPVACYTLSKAKKTKFCESLYGVKVPSGYSANIKSLVSIKYNKLIGMKSHDCHVLMTQMIPIAIRGILPDRIRHTITKLFLFFNMIHSKVIDHGVLDTWQSDIILTLCQLEMYFPPSFFDVMVHLVSHIVYEIKARGPVFLRYMYPFERYMGFLKGYVRNKRRPKGSIVEGYVSEEVIDFCNDYLEGVKNIGLPQPRHQGRLQGVGTIGMKVVVGGINDIRQAHFTVLQHMVSIAPYVQEHMALLKAKNRGKDNMWLTTEHNKSFSSWLKERGVKVDSDGFTLVYLSTNGYLSEPFILAKKATQVFFVEDPKDSKWHVVLHGKRRILGVDNVVDEEEYNQFDELPSFSVGITSTNDVIDDTSYLRTNHNETHIQIVEHVDSLPLQKQRCLGREMKELLLDKHQRWHLKQYGPWCRNRRTCHKIQNGISKPKRCAFLNPNIISQEICSKAPEKAIDYIKATTSLRNKYYIIPYFQGAVGCLTWDQPMCQQQEVEWECGYYIMKWMHQFILFDQHRLHQEIPWISTQPLSATELERIVSTWISEYLKP